MERLGISAVIFEDKTGLKQNSLFQNTSNQKQEDKKNLLKKNIIDTQDTLEELKKPHHKH